MNYRDGTPAWERNKVDGVEVSLPDSVFNFTIMQKKRQRITDRAKRGKHLCENGGRRTTPFTRIDCENSGTEEFNF